MRKITLFLFAAMLLAVTGCASNLMQQVTHDDQLLPEDQAAIVFYRPSSFGGAIQAPVVEATDGKLELVGIVSSGYKVLHLSTPGTHYFVVGGESSNLLEARLDGGKFYYVVVEPYLGFAKARFELEPTPFEELGSSNFMTNMGYCKWVVSKPEAQTWFNSNLPSLNSKYTDAMTEHMQKPEDKRNIMGPEYGASEFYK